MRTVFVSILHSIAGCKLPLVRILDPCVWFTAPFILYVLLCHRVFAEYSYMPQWYMQAK
jgi:hypothetical protein